MGKYMRKAKTAGEVAVMELSQPSLSGVRTRAKTLALQRLQKSQQQSVTASSGSYLQLRSRRLEKPPIVVNESKRQKQRESCVQNQNPNPNRNSNSRLRAGDGSGSVGPEKEKEEKEKEKEKEKEEEEIIQENKDLGIEPSFGENVVDFEGRERSTRESTPCSLMKDPDTIRTPGSTTRPTSSTETNRRIQNSKRRHIPTAHEMNEFFAGAEEEQQRQFIEKYNFDPLTDEPLPGRFVWEKVDP